MYLFTNKSYGSTPPPTTHYPWWGGGNMTKHKNIQGKKTHAAAPTIFKINMFQEMVLVSCIECGGIARNMGGGGSISFPHVWGFGGTMTQPNFNNYESFVQKKFVMSNVHSFLNNQRKNNVLNVGQFLFL